VFPNRAASIFSQVLKSAVGYSVIFVSERQSSDFGCSESQFTVLSFIVHCEEKRWWHEANVHDVVLPLSQLRFGLYPSCLWFANTVCGHTT